MHCCTNLHGCLVGFKVNIYVGTRRSGDNDIIFLRFGNCIGKQLDRTCCGTECHGVRSCFGVGYRRIFVTGCNWVAAIESPQVCSCVLAQIGEGNCFAFGDTGCTCHKVGIQCCRVLRYVQYNSRSESQLPVVERHIYRRGHIAVYSTRNVNVELTNLGWRTIYMKRLIFTRFHIGSAQATAKSSGQV